VILKVAVPRCLGPSVTPICVSARPATSLGQRFDLSRGRARGGPAQLIKMATGQLPDAYGMRRQPPVNGDTFQTNNALDYRDLAGSLRTPRSGLGSACAAWAVNLFSQGRVI
jgi:hypothetical protein